MSSTTMVIVLLCEMLTSSDSLHTLPRIFNWNQPSQQHAEGKHTEGKQNHSSTTKGHHLFPLSEVGYQQAAQLKDDEEMTKFIRRLLSVREKTIENEGDLAGFVPFYSGRLGVQTLQQMEHELFNSPWVVDSEREKVRTLAALSTDANLSSSSEKKNAKKRRHRHRKSKKPETSDLEENSLEGRDGPTKHDGEQARVSRHCSKKEHETDREKCISESDGHAEKEGKTTRKGKGSDARKDSPASGQTDEQDRSSRKAGHKIARNSSVAKDGLDAREKLRQSSHNRSSAKENAHAKNRSFVHGQSHDERKQSEKNALLQSEAVLVDEARQPHHNKSEAVLVDEARQAHHKRKRGKGKGAAKRGKGASKGASVSFGNSTDDNVSSKHSNDQLRDEEAPGNHGRKFPLTDRFFYKMLKMMVLGSRAETPAASE